MNKIIKTSLYANASSLGLNWVYNIPYLERLSKNEDILFQTVDPAKYKRARKAVMGYPNAKVGDVSLQGEILKWLYNALEENPELSKEEYEKLIYEHIKPGGDYEGWIESYGKKLVFNETIKELELDRDPLEIHDDQMVGFIPYYATKALNLPTEKAFELTQAFTNEEDYQAFFEVFDQLIDDLKDKSFKDALKNSLNYIPKHYGFKLNMALNVEHPKDLLKIVSNACAISYAVPLVYTILYHTNSLDEALKLNTVLGGASSDRGTLIGFLYSFKETPSDESLNILNL